MYFIINGLILFLPLKEIKNYPGNNSSFFSKQISVISTAPIKFFALPADGTTLHVSNSREKSFENHVLVC